MLMHAELDLPSGYESYEQFRQKLLLAITEVRSSLLTLPRSLFRSLSLARSFARPCRAADQILTSKASLASARHKRRRSSPLPAPFPSLLLVASSRLTSSP